MLCKKCGLEQTSDRFYLHRQGPRTGQPKMPCKACVNIQCKAWRSSNLEKARNRDKISSARHSSKRVARQMAWRRENPELWVAAKKRNFERNCADVSSTYVLNLLRAQNIPKSAITRDLLELVKYYILIRREILNANNSGRPR